MNIPTKTIKAALLFAPTADIRYYLNSILLDQGPDGTFIVATDGAAAFVSMIDVGHQPPAKYLIPLTLANHAAKSKTTDVEFKAAPGSLTLAGMTAAPVEGIYPDWRRVCKLPAQTGEACFDGDYAAKAKKAGKFLGVKQGFIKPYGQGCGVAWLDSDTAVWVMPLLSRLTDKFTIPNWVKS